MNMFLPNSCYKYPQFLDELEKEGENQPQFIIEGLTFENEPLKKIQGTDIPYRLNVGDEELEMINIYKASMMATVSLINPINIIPTLISLISVKERNRVIGWFKRLGFKSVQNVILNYQHWSTFHKELYTLIFAILIKSKIDETNSRQLAEHLSYVIEYDTAYKTRLQDLFNETTPDKITTRKEIKRLLNLFVSRNKDKDVIKYKKFVFILTFALLIPKVKRIFKESLAHINWKNLCPDEIDKYWMSMKVEYDYEGKTLEERLDEGFKKWKYAHTKEEYLKCKID
jgi:hypothetical protein